MNPLYTQLLEQDQNQQPQNEGTSPFESNPIASGVVSALDSARLSFQRRENQSQESFSKALAAMAQAAAQQPQNQWGMSKRKSFMRAAGAALPTGVMAYQNNEDAARMEQKQALENAWKMQQHEKEKELVMAQHAQQLDEQKRHHMAVEALSGLRHQFDQRQDFKQQKEMEQALKNQQLIAEGKIPLGDGDKEAAKAYRKHTQELENSDSQKVSIIDDVDTMLRIIDKYEKKGEDISTDALNIFAELDEKPASGVLNFIQNIGKRFVKSKVDKERLNDLQQLAKAAASLNVNTIISLKGARPTDLLKRSIVAAGPGPGMTSQAIRKVAMDWKERATDDLQYSEKRRKAQFKGYEYSYQQYIKEKREALDQQMAQQQQQALEVPQIAKGEAILNLPTQSDSSGVVKMRFPDGTIRPAPANKVDHFIQQGGEVVQ